MSTPIVPDTYPNLSHLLGVQLAAAPGHQRFFEKRFADTDDAAYAFLEEVATMVRGIAGDDLETYAADYVWLCERQMEEELYFRRHGDYRLKTFEEANREVYADKPYMTKYMNGLLMTELWWSNHTSAMHFYRDTFLTTLAADASLLEIGPGHGLLLHLACEALSGGQVSAWDLSPASIAATHHSLGQLGTSKTPNIVLQDLYEAPEETRYDAIVFSEILEHLEEPRGAVEKLSRLLSPGGRCYIHMPINSPAPDHLFLLRSPEEFVSFLESCGLRCVETGFFPATNVSYERAVRKNLTINCVAIAETA